MKICCFSFFSLSLSRSLSRSLRSSVRVLIVLIDLQTIFSCLSIVLFFFPRRLFLIYEKSFDIDYLSFMRSTCACSWNDTFHANPTFFDDRAVIFCAFYPDFSCPRSGQQNKSSSIVRLFVLFLLFCLCKLISLGNFFMAERFS